MKTAFLCFQHFHFWCGSNFEILTTFFNPSPSLSYLTTIILHHGNQPPHTTRSQNYYTLSSSPSTSIIKPMHAPPLKPQFGHEPPLHHPNPELAHLTVTFLQCKPSHHHHRTMSPCKFVAVPPQTCHATTIVLSFPSLIGVATTFCFCIAHPVQFSQHVFNQAFRGTFSSFFFNFFSASFRPFLCFFSQCIC